MLVLFDFDGTLADSAPDLVAATNHVRQLHQLPPLPFETLRLHVSNGVAGLLKEALGITPDSTDFEQNRTAFLAYYEAHVCDKTHLFEGISDLLNELDQAHIKWGIVTNKHERFAQIVFDKLGLNKRTPACVCGDTLIYAKPDPAPIFYAAGLLRTTPQSGIYIGDDERDIVAGRRAGMKTIAAAYGYCTLAQAQSWNADALAQHPHELLPLITKLLAV